ncbi:MAG: PaaI family thioesterase [Alcanivoracaceae bacterium]|jgi:acyl-coenzyme A thioesterase PaaI-like protein|nr:PaaI family thioesterase [Alcanivoracaceae bacterium]
MTETYSFNDILVGQMPAPTEESVVRREIANEIRQLTERLIRVDADTETLAQVAAGLRQVSSALDGHGKRELGDILQRLVAGQASRQDLLDMLDFEILTGRATPLSPPMELWLDGEVVRGKARFGLPWQGPPGRVHGGVIGLVMDILLAKTQDFFQGWGMTGTLNIRYQSATPLDTDIELEARVVEVSGRKLFNEGRIIVGGRDVVVASGIWICAGGDYRWKPAYQKAAEA